MASPEATESRVRSMLGGGSAVAPVEPDADDPSGDIDPEAMTLEAGGAEMIAAVQSGDAGAVARAFDAMFEAKMRRTVSEE